VNVEHNYSQFCDLYCGDRLIASEMVHLVFRPDGTITNRDRIIFKVSRKHRGEFTVRLLGAYLDSTISANVLRPGDTVTVAAGNATIYVEPKVRAS